MILDLGLKPIPKPEEDIQVRISTTAGELFFSFTAPADESKIATGTVLNLTDVRSGKLYVVGMPYPDISSTISTQEADSFVAVGVPKTNSTKKFTLPNMQSGAYDWYLVMAFIDTNGDKTWNPENDEPFALFGEPVRRGRQDITLTLEKPSEKASEQFWQDFRELTAAAPGHCGIDLIAVIPYVGDVPKAIVAMTSGTGNAVISRRGK